MRHHQILPHSLTTAFPPPTHTGRHELGWEAHDNIALRKLDGLAGHVRELEGFPLLSGCEHEFEENAVQSAHLTRVILSHLQLGRVFLDPAQPWEL
jgi:hypothetical protein